MNWEELAVKAVSGDSQALGQLVLSQEKLIYKIMHKRGIPNDSNFEDVAHDILLYLYEAFPKFNPSKGFKITTYSTRCIDNKLNMIYRESQALKRQGLAISMETSVYENITVGDTLVDPRTIEDEEIAHMIDCVERHLSDEYKEFFYACHYEKTKSMGIYEYCEMKNTSHPGKYNEKFKCALAKAMGYSYLKSSDKYYMNNRDKVIESSKKRYHDNKQT